MQADKQARIDIAKALAVASFVITGNEIHAVALDAMVEDLIGYGVPNVLAAISRCRRECKGRFALADIIERMESADGRPGADEAWMNALLAHDESNSVVWTYETEQAFAIARPALEINDKVGARMAFRDAYERLVTASRERGEPATWSVTLGWDVEQRRRVLEAAVQCGRLLPNHAAGLLPPPQDYPRNESEMVLRLACVNGDVVDDESLRRDVARKRLAELKAMLAQKKA